MNSLPISGGIGLGGRITAGKSSVTTTGSMSGAINIWGYVKSLNATTQVGTISVAPRLGGRIATGGQVAPGAFKDFAIYPAGAVDPAMSYIQSSNAGTSSVDNTNVPTHFARAFIKASAPADYPVSGGGYAWKRAAYAGLGVKFKGMINGAPASLQYVDGWQDEVATLSAAGPAVYTPARALSINVQPTRLNFIWDPKCLGSSNWNPTSSSVTTATATQPGYLPAGTTSGQTVTISANNGANALHGYTTTITGLTPGVQYVAHIRVVSNPSLGAIHLVTTDGTPMISEQPTTSALPDPVNPKFQRIWCTFVTTGPTVTIGVGVYGSDLPASLPATFVMACGVLEAGRAPGTYFDGATDTTGDYLWEVGQTADNARSFYYEDRNARSSLMTKVLQDNVPMGIPFSAPVFGVFQYTHSPAYWLMDDPEYSLLAQSTFLY